MEKGVEKVGSSGYTGHQAEHFFLTLLKRAVTLFMILLILLVLLWGVWDAYMKPPRRNGYTPPLVGPQWKPAVVEALGRWALAAAYGIAVTVPPYIGWAASDRQISLDMLVLLSLMGVTAVAALCGIAQKVLAVWRSVAVTAVVEALGRWALAAAYGIAVTVPPYIGWAASDRQISLDMLVLLSLMGVTAVAALCGIAQKVKRLDWGNEASVARRRRMPVLPFWDRPRLTPRPRLLDADPEALLEWKERDAYLREVASLTTGVPPWVQRCCCWWADSSLGRALRENADDVQRQRENISKERAVRAFMYRELRKTWNVLSEGCRERVSAIKVAKLLGEEQARAEAAERERLAEMAKPDEERVFLAARRAAVEQIRLDELEAAAAAVAFQERKAAVIGAAASTPGGWKMMKTLGSLAAAGKDAARRCAQVEAAAREAAEAAARAEEESAAVRRARRLAEEAEASALAAKAIAREAAARLAMALKFDAKLLSRTTQAAAAAQAEQAASAQAAVERAEASRAQAEAAERREADAKEAALRAAAAVAAAEREAAAAQGAAQQEEEEAGAVAEVEAEHRLVDRQGDSVGFLELERQRVAAGASLEAVVAASHLTSSPVKLETVAEGDEDEEAGAEDGSSEHLLLGVSLAALRQSVAGLPPDCLTQFQQAGGYVARDLTGSTGSYGYGKQALEVNGYVNELFLRRASRSAGGASFCERLREAGSAEVGRATVFVSSARQLPMSELIAALEHYVETHPELPSDARFWIFDYSTRFGRSGVALTGKHLGFIIGEIANTVLVLEPWVDAYALRRAFCVADVAYTARLGTLVSGDALPPAFLAAGKTHVITPHRFELAMSKGQQQAFDKSLHSDYAKVEALLALVSKMDLFSTAVRRRTDRDLILHGLTLGVVPPADMPVSVAKVVNGTIVGVVGADDSLGMACASANELNREALGLPPAPALPVPSGAIVYSVPSTKPQVAGPPFIPSTGTYATASPAERQVAYESSAAARALIRKSLLQHARRLLAAVPKERRSQTQIVRHIDLLSKQLDVDRLRDELGNEHSQTLDAITFLANSLRSGGDDSSHPTAHYQPPQVLELYSEVMKTRRRLLGDLAPETLSAINNVAVALYERGDVVEAGQYFKEVLRARRDALGEDHPSTLAVVSSYGTTLRQKGETAQAITMLQRALEGRRATLGDKDEATIRSILSLANALYADDQNAEALPLYREALSTATLALGKSHPLTLNAVNNLGCVLYVLGELAEAEACVREGLEGSRAVFGNVHLETLISAVNMMWFLLGKGSPDAGAAERRKRSAELREIRHLLGEAKYVLEQVGEALRWTHPKVVIVREKLEELEPALALAEQTGAPDGDDDDDGNVPADAPAFEPPSEEPPAEEPAPPPEPPLPPPPSPLVPDGHGSWASVESVNYRELGKALLPGDVIELLPSATTLDELPEDDAEAAAAVKMHLGMIVPPLGQVGDAGRKFLLVKTLAPSADEEGLYEMAPGAKPVVCQMSQVWRVKSEGHLLSNHLQYIRDDGALVLPPRREKMVSVLEQMSDKVIAGIASSSAAGGVDGVLEEEDGKYVDDEEEDEEAEEAEEPMSPEAAATTIAAFERGHIARKKAPGLVMKQKRRRKRNRKKKRKTTTTKGFKDKADAATMIAKVALGRAVRMSKMRAAVGGYRWPDPSRTDHQFALPLAAATAAGNGGGGGAAAAKAVGGESGGGGKGSVGKGSAPARLGPLVALGAFGGEKRQPPRALPSLPETSPEHKLKLPAREETLEVSSSQRPSSKDFSDESMASRLARMRQDRADQRSHRPTARGPEVDAIAIASSPSSPPSPKFNVPKIHIK